VLASIPGLALALLFFAQTASHPAKRLSKIPETARVDRNSTVASNQEERVLNSFESDTEMSIVAPRDTTFRLTSDGVTHGQRALAIEFRQVQWPALFLRPPAPWDLREWGEIAYDITNPGTTAIRFSVRVDDDIRTDSVVAWRTGSATIEPGATATFAFPLVNRDSMNWGLRGLPVWPGARNLGSTGTHVLNTGNIAQMQIFLGSPAENFTVIVDNVRLRPPYPLAGIVDRFGQFTGNTWPGKIETEEELELQKNAEAESLSDVERFDDRSEFGGFTAGPQLEATGYFRTAKHEGRWWLVDPEGYLFFSSGFNSMGLAQTTFTTGREDMFTWLPSDEDPLTKHFSTATAVSGLIRTGTTFNFHAANLERKHGADYVAAWRSLSLARMKAWGFNTIGKWSDNGLHRRGLPYVTTTLFGNYNTVPNAGQGTDRLPDPFDTRFATSVRERLLPVLTPAISDPYCLGHFVDNEMNWGSPGNERARYGVALGALSQNPANSAARRALGALLEKRYTTIENLNTQWGTQFASWSALAAPATITAGMRADLSELTSAFAREYYRVVREELRRIDPNHLYLGSRIHQVNPDVIAGAAPEVDVLSFDVYQAAIAPAGWTQLERVDRPAIIGEFHFGALDRGMFSTGL